MEEILLVGAGGHCKSVLDAIKRSSSFKVYGILDIESNIGQTILGHEICYTDNQLIDLFQQGIRNVFITVAGIGNPKLRIELFSKCKEIGFQFPIIIDTSAVVSNYSKIGKGVFIGKNAVVNADVIIGDMAIINTASVIEHDCEIGEFASISPSATLSGGVKVGAYTHVGTNVTVIEGIVIGMSSIIGAGSVVVKDIDSNCKAYGIPCKEVERWPKKYL